MIQVYFFIDMATKTKAEISRLNGSKSQGAITERGKAIASINATKHGILSSKPPLLLSEDFDFFNTILDGLMADYEPLTTTEKLLINQLAVGYLRLHRLWGVEASIVNLQMMRKQSDLSSLNVDGSFLDPQNNQTFDQLSVQGKAFPHRDEMDRLLRYERHITRQINDCLDRLTSIQQRRNEDSVGSIGEN